MGNDMLCGHCKWWVELFPSQQPEPEGRVLGKCRRHAPRPTDGLVHAAARQEARERNSVG
jgi:hypothetical protein